MNNADALLITRKDHDTLIDFRPELLAELFAVGGHRWSLAGVTFYGVTDEQREEVARELQPMPHPEDAPGFVEFPRGEFNPSFIY